MQVTPRQFQASEFRSSSTCNDGGSHYVWKNLNVFQCVHNWHRIKDNDKNKIQGTSSL